METKNEQYLIVTYKVLKEVGVKPAMVWAYLTRYEDTDIASLPYIMIAENVGMDRGSIKNYLDTYETKKWLDSKLKITDTGKEFIYQKGNGERFIKIDLNMLSRLLHVDLLIWSLYKGLGEDHHSIGVEKIAGDTGLSISYTEKLLARLKEHGWLHYQKTRTKNGNVKHLCMAIVSTQIDPPGRSLVKKKSKVEPPKNEGTPPAPKNETKGTPNKKDVAEKYKKIIAGYDRKYNGALDKAIDGLYKNYTDNKYLTDIFHHYSPYMSSWSAYVDTHINYFKEKWKGAESMTVSHIKVDSPTWLQYKVYLQDTFSIDLDMSEDSIRLKKKRTRQLMIEQGKATSEDFDEYYNYLGNISEINNRKKEVDTCPHGATFGRGFVTIEECMDCTLYRKCSDASYEVSKPSVAV